jgi:hypothetical protein
MASDNQALLLQVSADTSKALKQLDRLQDRIKGVSRQADKSLGATNDNLARKFGRGIGGALNNELQGIAQRAGPAAGALEGFGAAGLAAAAALGALTVAAGRAIEAMAFGDELQASADKLQITAEALQELQFAAEETDVPLETLQQGLERLNGSIGAFKTGIGGKRVSSAFEALGISKESLKDVTNANELLPILADRLGQVSDTASQVQIAKKLGIEGLLPLLRQGSDGLAEMRDRARELGLVISNDTVKALADADRQMELATRQIQSGLRVAFAGVAVDIAKAVTALAEFLTALRQSQAGWAVFARTIGRLPRQAVEGTINLIPGGRQAQAAATEADRRARARQRVADIKDALSKPLPTATAAEGFALNLPSGGGGGKGKAAKEVRDTTLQRQQEIDRAFRDVERDLLNAWQSLLVEAENRAELQRQLLALEIEGRNADLDRQKADIAADEGLSAAKKEELAASVEKVRAQYEGVDALRREAIDRELAQQKAAESLSLRTAEIDAQEEAVSLQAGLARTAKEERTLRLELLDLADQRVRLEQEAIIASKASTDAQKEEARLRLKQLDATRGAREEGVRGGTQGPLEEFFDSLPRGADEINEAFQRVAAGGLADTIDGLAQVAAGMTSIEDFGRQMIQQLAYEVTRVNLQALLAKAFPGLSEAASGAQAGAAITTAGTAAGGSMGAAITTSGATAAQGMGAAIVAAGSQAATAIAAAMASGGAAGSGASSALSFLKLASSFSGASGGSAFFTPNPAMSGGFNFTLPAYASGTNSARGGLSLVGEHGPELINLKRGAQVIPNDILRTLARNRNSPAAPSRTFSQTLNVSVQGAGMSAADARRTGAQIGAAAQREMALAKRRGY